MKSTHKTEEQKKAEIVVAMSDKIKPLQATNSLFKTRLMQSENGRKAALAKVKQLQAELVRIICELDKEKAEVQASIELVKEKWND